MKNIITIIGLASLISLNIMSQDLKGKVLLSGLIGLGLNDNETSDFRLSNSESFFIKVPAGYFISNKFAVGLIGDYSHRSSEYSYKTETNSYGATRKTESYLIGPFVRMYFPIVEKLMVFVHFDNKFGTSKNEGTDLKSDGSTSNTSGTMSLFNADLYPGLNYRITNKLMLEAGFAKLNYSSSKGNTTRDNGDPENKESSVFSFRANYLSFGLTLVL